MEPNTLSPTVDTGAIVNTGAGAIAVLGGIAAGQGGAAAGQGGTATVVNIGLSSPADGVGALAEVLDRIQPPKRRPHAPPPRPPIAMFGREGEQRSIEQRLGAGTPVAIVGGDGAGKSTLLASLANSPAAVAQDGVLLVEGRGEGRGFHELVQRLYGMVWETGSTRRVVDVDVARADFDGIVPLLVVDGWTLDADEQRSLVNLFPASAVLYASTSPANGGVFDLTAVGRLDRASSALLLANRARMEGRASDAGIERACELLHDWPGALGTLGDTVVAGRVTLADAIASIEARAEAEPPGLDPAIVGYQRLWYALQAALPGPERRVLRTLAALPGESASPQIVELALAEHADSSALAQLKEAGIVWANSPRLRMDAGLKSYLHESFDASSTLLRLAVIEDPDIDPDDSATWVAATAEAARSGLDPEAVRLARRLDPILLGSGHWGSWRELLTVAAGVAERLGDRVTHGWALHQLGTRALAQGDMEQAASNLRLAMEIRNALGEGGAIDRTQHNLDVLKALTPPAAVGITRTRRDGPRVNLRSAGIWTVIMTVVIGIAAVLGAPQLLAGLGSSPTSSPGVEPSAQQSESAPPPDLVATPAFVVDDVLPTGDWSGSVTVNVTGGQKPYVFEPAGSTGAEGARSYQVAGTECAPTNFMVAVRSADGQEKIIEEPFRPDRCATYAVPDPPSEGEPDGDEYTFNCETYPVVLKWRPGSSPVDAVSWVVEVIRGSDDGGWSDPTEIGSAEREPRFSYAAPCATGTRWRVAGVSADGWRGPYSSSFGFTIAQTAVPKLLPERLLKCIGDGFPNQQLLEWRANPADGIALYKLEIEDVTAGTPPTPYESGETGLQVPVTCDNEYRWRVASVDRNQMEGTFADWRAFKTLPFDVDPPQPRGTLAIGVPSGATTLIVTVDPNSRPFMSGTTLDFTMSRENVELNGVMDGPGQGQVTLQVSPVANAHQAAEGVVAFPATPP